MRGTMYCPEVEPISSDAKPLYLRMGPFKVVILTKASGFVGFDKDKMILPVADYELVTKLRPV